MALLLVGCSDASPLSTVQGSGQVQRQVRRITSFSQLQLDCAADVEFHRAPQVSLIVEADDNVLPMIQTDVQGQKLVISSSGSYSSAHTVRVSVTGPSLDRAEINSSGQISASGLQAEHFTAAISGSGNLSASGSATVVNVDLQGSGNIDLGQLDAKKAEVTLSGSGSILVHATQSLNANLSGSGDIRCTGHPSDVHRNVSGSGQVRLQ